MVAMRLRKTLTPEVLAAILAAHKSGLDFTIAELEAQYLAGGNVQDVVKSAMALRASAVPFDRRKLLGVDLARGNTWDFVGRFLKARQVQRDLTFEGVADRYLRGEWPVE